jgi:crotonobetainyl-CoA:carnitine CoA-transferase CaiB-like acyl-CoA transferase
LIFADLGARVIKLEPPGGDLLRHAGRGPAKGEGPIFTALNRDKQLETLDARTPDGKARLIALLGEADVFFHNVRMDGMERLGFGPDAVRAINPRVVYVHCAGFGADGPYAARQAYDDLIQAASGYADLHRRRDGDPPRYAPSLIADKTCGLFAAYATMAALFHRERTGEAQTVRVPMLESFTFFNMVENLYGETFIPPTGPMAYSRSINPRRRPYPTKDGFIAIVPYSDDQWRTFFELGGMPDVFEDPRFASYPARAENVDALYARIEEVSATRTTEDWLTLLDAANIPAMRYNTLEQVLTDPHLASTGFFETREDDRRGQWRAMRHPVRFNAE